MGLKWDAQQNQVTRLLDGFLSHICIEKLAMPFRDNFSLRRVVLGVTALFKRTLITYRWSRCYCACGEHNETESCTFSLRGFHSV